MSVTKIYKCECHGEAICVETFKEDEDKEVIFSFWDMSHYASVMAWPHRLKLIWKIITKGTPYTDMVILDFPTANEMAHDIIKHTEPKKWINKEGL